MVLHHLHCLFDERAAPQINFNYRTPPCMWEDQVGFLLMSYSSFTGERLHVHLFSKVAASPVNK